MTKYGKSAPLFILDPNPVQHFHAAVCNMTQASCSATVTQPVANTLVINAVK